MYLFGKITVKPQLPERISELYHIANNLWWSWNSYALRLYDYIDSNLFSKVGKNPVKFLSRINQKRLLEVANDTEFLKDYDLIVENFKNYLSTDNTYFNRNFPNNKNDMIAYFSAEYGLDEILPIYAGGLGILSGDHLKSASDLGIPFVGIGLLYKQGYFNQFINKDGSELFDYSPATIEDLPVLPVLDENGNDLIISVEFPGRIVYLKIWKILVGRVTLYLMDSDIDLNAPTDRQLTLKLYGGNQEMRISQEVILGIGGMRLLRALQINPTVYHMNEGHSSFVALEVIKKIMFEKEVSFDVARKIASACTIFTTHTPVPAGNDIFPVDLVDKYFDEYCRELGLSRNDFLNLGTKKENDFANGFNMAVLALKIAGSKNGVSKLHGEVSRGLFSDLWSETASNEIPIDYVTNGVHTCTWLAPTLKELYNAYMRPFWQEQTYDIDIWNDIDNIPDAELWNAHMVQKNKLGALIRKNIKAQKVRHGASVEEINEVDKLFNPNALTIGFARRFATYKRADLIFKDLERITKILNDPSRPVQIVFAGKPHPADIQGQELVKRIYEISEMPQFKGKVFILENYNMYVARYLVSGVDVWLNNPRRPLEASGTSGEKAGVNGVINFSVLDGWWYEGFNGQNGWAIGDDTEYTNYELQDNADSQSIYNILENEIIPLYYSKENVSEDGARNTPNLNLKWIKKMKASIKTVGGNYNTGRMLVDYLRKFYIPQMDRVKAVENNIDAIQNYLTWEQDIRSKWPLIKITPTGNLEELAVSAGNNVNMTCNVFLNGVSPESATVEVYCGRLDETGKMINSLYTPMNVSKDNGDSQYEYSAELLIDEGGNYGYTFRVLPKHELLINKHDLSLCKWLTD
ncbi:MAG: alpha-glucan family phosphorylase [Clostridia bacterium]|nr:alpha-glucan family phosphorylase [Clostridia bacterium]